MLYSNNSFFLFLKSLFLKYGLDIKRASSQSSLESHLTASILDLGIDLVIDVGANAGQFGRLLRMLGYFGEIISFEPGWIAFEKLKTISDNDSKWKVENIALGDFIGSLDLNEYTSNEFNSFLNINEFAKTRFSHSVRLNGVRQVPVNTLDNYFYENQISAKKIFLKMDTQGYDQRVFKGARTILEKIVLLQSEISFVRVYENSIDYKSLISEYEVENFQISGIFPVSRAFNLSIIEADLIMVK